MTSAHICASSLGYDHIPPKLPQLFSQDVCNNQCRGNSQTLCGPVREYCDCLLKSAGKYLSACWIMCNLSSGFFFPFPPSDGWKQRFVLRVFLCNDSANFIIILPTYEFDTPYGATEWEVFCSHSLLGIKTHFAAVCNRRLSKSFPDHMTGRRVQQLETSCTLCKDSLNVF